MDTQNLKMILDALHDAGVGAWWIALLYILQGYLQMVVVAGVILTVVLKVPKMLLNSLSLHGELDSLFPGMSIAPGTRGRSALVGFVAKHVKEIEEIRHNS